MRTRHSPRLASKRGGMLRALRLLRKGTIAVPRIAPNEESAALTSDPASEFDRFGEVGEAISATPAKLQKVRLLAEYLHGEFDALESLIETIEPAHFKVPVLFRQYLKQNARFIAFNVDPNFSNCLDGLMILDVAQLPESTIEALQQEK